MTEVVLGLILITTVASLTAWVCHPRATHLVRDIRVPNAGSASRAEAIIRGDNMRRQSEKMKIMRNKLPWLLRGRFGSLGGY
jgi:hypothetical protein